MCKSYITGVQRFVPRRRRRRRGESERQLSFLLRPLSSRYLSRDREKKKKKSSRIKGTNYILPQTFGLMSKWGSVVISALSPQRSCFSLSRATCSRAAPPRRDPACTDSSRGTANPFICRCSSYLPHGDGWEGTGSTQACADPLGAGRDIPAKPSECTQTQHRREEGKKREGGGVGGLQKRQATSKTQTNLK